MNNDSFTTISLPIQEFVTPPIVIDQALQCAIQKYGPTVRIDGLSEITCVSRSKAYQLKHTDPTFPKGTPIYDSDNSPRFYWTHEAVAWLEARSNKFNNQKDTNHE